MDAEPIKHGDLSNRAPLILLLYIYIYICMYICIRYTLLDSNYSRLSSLSRSEMTAINYSFAVIAGNSRWFEWIMYVLDVEMGRFRV